MYKNEFEGLLKIDLKKLISQHFQYGMNMEGVLLHHTRDDAVVYVINSDSMRLIYRCQEDNCCGYMKQKISLDWESQQYGSTSVHFICPECGKKATVLCDNGVSFMCKKCTRMNKSLY